MLDLNDRYFDFNENFDGEEKDFNTSNVIWIKWCSKRAPKTTQENWRRSRVEYLDEQTEITANVLAEALTEFGDVSIVKDSPFSAFVEFSSFNPSDFKRGLTKESVFKNAATLKSIQIKLEND